MQNERWGLVSACGHPVFPAPLVKNPLFFPVCIFGTFVKNQMGVAARVYFWML
jgi:hypothetical protein